MLEVNVIRYGEDEDQFFRVFRPTRSFSTSDTPLSPHGSPVAVLIHGGFWKQKYSADNALIDKLVPSLCEKGLVTVLLEYRRGREHIDGGRGGWPNSNIDIALALQKLESINNHEGDFMVSC